MVDGPSGPSGQDGPHAFVADLAAPVLDPADHHHFARVVRLRVGDPLTVSDGRGAWRACRFGDAGAVLTTVDDVLHVPQPEPRITVAFALVKGEKPEWIVQKLTELGVDRIVPFLAERSVVKWNAQKADAQQARLERVAREAGMQSRRCWLPEISRVATFGEAAALPGACLADRGNDAPTLLQPTILVGPEGGWSPTERACGLPVVGLGSHVMRAETASVVAGALLAAQRSGLLQPPAN